MNNTPIFEKSQRNNTPIYEKSQRNITPISEKSQRNNHLHCAEGVSPKPRFSASHTACGPIQSHFLYPCLFWWKGHWLAPSITGCGFSRKKNPTFSADKVFYPKSSINFAIRNPTPTLIDHLSLIIYHWTKVSSQVD